MGRPLYVKTDKEAKKYVARRKTVEGRRQPAVSLVVIKNMLRRIEERLDEIDEKLYQMKEEEIW